MDLGKVLAQLRRELEHLDAAIVSLERLQEHGAHRRGRPPEWLVEAKKPARNSPGSTPRQAGKKETKKDSGQNR